MNHDIKTELLLREYDHMLKIQDESVFFVMNSLKYLLFIIISTVISLQVSWELYKEYYQYVAILLIIIVGIVGYLSAGWMITALYSQLRLSFIERKLPIKKGIFTIDLKEWHEKNKYNKFINCSSKFFDRRLCNYWIFCAFAITIIYGIIFGFVIASWVNYYWDISLIIRFIIFGLPGIAVYLFLLKYLIKFQIENTFHQKLLNIIKKIEDGKIPKTNA